MSSVRNLQLSVGKLLLTAQENILLMTLLHTNNLRRLFTWQWMVGNGTDK